MPIYEYRCQSCHKITEEVRRMADSDNPMRCECGGEADRVITTVPCMIIPYGRFMNTTDRTAHSASAELDFEPKTMRIPWEAKG